MQEIKSLNSTQIQSLGWEDPQRREWQYSCLENSSILAWRISWRGVGQATVYGVTKSWTQLSNFDFQSLEKYKV